MVSGVGFKSSIDEEQEGAPRKRMVGRGLTIAFVILILVLAGYFSLKFWHESLVAESTAIDNEIAQINADIEKILVDGDVADFASRAIVMESDLYRGYDTNDVLNEIESIMVLKSSDGSGARVVLKSFEHSVGKVNISADADNFDVMAQQIEQFKNSPMFDNIVVGTTDRDDTGRIIFELSMSVVKYDRTPYEKENVSVNKTQDEPVEDITNTEEIARPEPNIDVNVIPDEINTTDGTVDAVNVEGEPVTGDIDVTL